MKKNVSDWDALISRLEKQFNSEISLKGILYLIGIQEVNQGIKPFDKEEKVNVLHVAICKLLIPYGYFSFEKIDSDGWPHYKELKPLKNLSDSEQKSLIKKAILNFFN